MGSDSRATPPAWLYMQTASGLTALPMLPTSLPAYTVAP